MIVGPPLQAVSGLGASAGRNGWSAAGCGCGLCHPSPRSWKKCMYPLNVTLVGCQDSVQRNVLSMLINQQANLDGQYADVDAAIAALREDTRGPRLFILSVPDSYSLPKLRQLVGVFVGQPILALVDA